MVAMTVVLVRFSLSLLPSPPNASPFTFYPNHCCFFFFFRFTLLLIHLAQILSISFSRCLHFYLPCKTFCSFLLAPENNSLFGLHYTLLSLLYSFLLTCLLTVMEETIGCVSKPSRCVHTHTHPFNK